MERFSAQDESEATTDAQDEHSFQSSDLRSSGLLQPGPQYVKGRDERMKILRSLNRSETKQLAEKSKEGNYSVKGVRKHFLDCLGKDHLAKHNAVESVSCSIQIVQLRV